MKREEDLSLLADAKFDVLVIGGGATGCGIALDAATRGLKVALVEQNDFSSGTSSRSTKLIHGGVRYLEQAVMKFDRSQFKLVRDALHERSTLLKIAPHLAHPLAILTPLYNLFDVPYYRTGLRLYDRLAGKKSLSKSFFIGEEEALKTFPMLKADKLKGGVVYYDGQFDDARMNVLIAATAHAQGAAVCNYAKVTRLILTKGKVTGAEVEDQLSKNTFSVSAKVVINAAGPFLDAIRLLEDKKARPLLSASSGTHIILDKKHSPPQTGLLIPKTEDGRVLFLLPWNGQTLVGTTDNPAPIVSNPKPTEEDIQFILRQVNNYFSLRISREEVRAAWTGLRPLVSDPKASDTAKLSRDHIINVSEHGLITIAGGKWTTYRKMASDTVDSAVAHAGLKAGPTLTETTLILGAENYRDDLYKDLQKKYDVDEETAIHLSRSYGSRCYEFLSEITPELKTKLHPDYPYLKAEVIHAVRRESARSVVDVLARRVRLGFLNTKATIEVASEVARLVAPLLKWSEQKQIEETKSVTEYFSY